MLARGRAVPDDLGISWNLSWLHLAFLRTRRLENRQFKQIPASRSDYRRIALATAQSSSPRPHPKLAQREALAPSANAEIL